VIVLQALVEEMKITIFATIAKRYTNTASILHPGYILEIDWLALCVNFEKIVCLYLVQWGYSIQFFF
jgi:hypothetical protein